MKKMMCLFIFVLFAAQAHGQQKLQVVTKTISQDLKQLLDSGIVVEGRKAVVEVTGWDKNYIQVEMDLIAKHPKRQVAEKELAYIQYAITKRKDRYVLKNLFYAEDQTAKVRSSLSVVYRIFLPVNQKVVVQNDYGAAKLRNLYGEVQINSRFSDLVFDRLFGSLKVSLDYCDVRGENLDGTLDFELRRTDINLKNFAGEVFVDNHLGSTELSPSSMLKSLNVSSRSGKVELLVKSIDAFNYDIKVYSSYITLPTTQSKLVQIDELLDEHAFKLTNGVSRANISITNMLESVEIGFVQSSASGNE